ncbi:peptide ABC transporter substrate-binding protein [Anaerotruncus colihominis]|uniref:peptide ABC transporter substrate-binding protein n=1 Tax=Anaerotruncus colihominis TaxID=169435 RepID=UPI0026ED479E|nr:peptide ABC transporter substrate-binding protein [Anaerotruncus colihominis]
MKQTRLLILLLALVVLLAGCSGGAGGPVRYDIPGGVSNLDPQFATAPAARMIISNTFEGLFRQMPDGNVQPCLAQSHEISSDGLTYTFHLRTDAVWTGGGKQYNGTPVTAHDFVFAFRRMFNSQAASPFAGEFSCLKNADAILRGALTADQLGVRAIGDHTLEITLDRPNALLPELLSASYARPCNESFFRSTRARYGFDLDSLIFNGPFYISIWNNEKRIALRPNPQYVSDEPVLSSGVDLYTSAFLDSAGGPVTRFLNGETDACEIGFESLPAVAAMGGDIEAFEDTVWVLVFNTRAEPFSNASVRRAYAHSLNRALFEGQLPKNLRAASMLIPPAVRMGGEPFRAYAGEDSPIAYSTELAKRYYAAGTGELGVPQIDPGEILVCGANSQKMLAGYVQQGLQRSFGLFSGLTVLPQDEVLSRVGAGDFSAAILPLTADYSSPDALFSYFRSDSGQNFSGYQNPEFDALLASVASLDAQGQLEAYREAERLLLTDGAVIPLYFETTCYATARGVSGIGFSPFLTGVSFRNAVRE